MANPRPPSHGNKNYDLDQIWDDLKQGSEHVYERRGMSKPRYMELYTYVYNYCTRNPNGNDTSGGGNRRSGRLQRPRVNGPAGSASGGALTSNFVGNDLYNRIRELIKNYLTDLAKKAKDKMSEDLVTFYLQEWERFTFSSKVMNGFCSYLNRHWIRREYDEGHEHVFQIYHLALDIWKETFFEPLHGQTISTVLQLINRERSGDTVNTGSIKGMTDYLVELGKDRNSQDFPQNQNHSDDLGIYQRRFEDPFINETESFYARESASFLQSGKSVSDYMKKADQRLSEERRRVNLYLHASTMDRLMKCCENVLIDKQLSALHDEFPILLRAQDVDDMARMYDLVSKLGDSFGNMRDILQTHISNEGSAAIAQNKESCNNDPKEYIKTILDVYQKFNGLVSTAFKQDPGFVAALDRACSVFINKNDLTRDTRTSHKTPEMLARYCDTLLRKSGKNYDDPELEEMLNQAMIIFKFIEDKDVFQKYYSRMLANRLVGNLSASDDAESSMITKLKIACGFEYTTKLQRMYQDVALAKDMNEDFKVWLGRQEIADPMKAEFYIMILSSGSWPFSPDVNDTFLLPQVLEPCVNIFSQYYGEMHTGRKMNWLYSKSKGEIVTNCFPRKYTFVMSTYSIGVLLQYNAKDSYKLRELAEATQLREDVITQVNLMVPLKTDVKLEDERAQTSIEQGRQHEIEAAIVRTMKARKSLDHQLLLSEVMRQVANRFTPAVPLIKRCIDNLIVREYLRRKEGEQNVYEYVA